MRVKLFTFRYCATLGGFDDRPLETFCRDKVLLAFREHFFQADGAPHLACVVLYQEAPPPAAAVERPSRERTPREDPYESLGEAERVLYNTLREWRAATARRQGLPPYVIFTNRQLAAIARARPEHATALSQIEGVGKSKLSRHGAELLALLRGENGA